MEMDPHAWYQDLGGEERQCQDAQCLVEVEEC